MRPLQRAQRIRAGEGDIRRFKEGAHYEDALRCRLRINVGKIYFPLDLGPTKMEESNIYIQFDQGWYGPIPPNDPNIMGYLHPEYRIPDDGICMRGYINLPTPDDPMERVRLAIGQKCGGHRFLDCASELERPHPPMLWGDTTEDFRFFESRVRLDNLDFEKQQETIPHKVFVPFKRCNISGYHGVWGYFELASKYEASQLTIPVYDTFDFRCPILEFM